MDIQKVGRVLLHGLAVHHRLLISVFFKSLSTCRQIAGGQCVEWFSRCAQFQWSCRCSVSSSSFFPFSVSKFTHNRCTYTCFVRFVRLLVCQSDNVVCAAMCFVRMCRVCGCDVAKRRTNTSETHTLVNLHICLCCSCERRYLCMVC